MEEKKVNIREFDGDRDTDVVQKLERDLEIGSRKGFSILTNMLGDPLCRVRLYPNHIMLVAELAEGGKVVGVVRGCIKSVVVGGGAGSVSVRVRCILGLRVSPKHRMMGIGSKLVKTLEEWATSNEAEYMFSAIEKNNTASINLFVDKCNYRKLHSLSIIAQPILDHNKNIKSPLSNIIKSKKLNTKHAISLYKDRLGAIQFFPLDIDAILNDRLSLGTWVSYFEHDQWSGLNEEEEEDCDDEIGRTPSSWAMISIWKTYELYKLQSRGAPILRCFQATLSHIGSKMLPCLKVLPSIELLSTPPFGFLFLYGIHGEGERVGELLGTLWDFACKMGATLKDCKAIVTELGVNDLMRGHVPWGSSTSLIDDVWYLKRVNSSSKTDVVVDGDLPTIQPFSRVFIDPRDF